CCAENSPELAPWLITLLSTAASVSGSGARNESMQVLHASRSACVGIVIHVSWAGVPTVPNVRRMPEPPHAIQSERDLDAPWPNATTEVVTEAAGSPFIVPSALTGPP